MYKSNLSGKMNSKDIKGLYEAYSAVYDEDLRDELEEMLDDFDGIENLTEEEIDAIVEETIDEMIEEGYDFDEVEEIFEGVLLEMNPYAPAGSKAAKAYNKSTTASKRGAERSAARAAAVSKVKGAVKSALGKAKEAATSAVGKAKKTIKDVKQQSHVGAAKYASKRGLMKGPGLKTQSSKGRAELRSAVAKDIKGRIKHKIAKAQVGAYGAAKQAGQAASDVAGKTKQSAKYTAARTKRGVKGAIGAVASKVASGASRLASRMATEEIDVYDIVLEHLVVEGYADTLESAEAIMANMSEEWRESIVEEVLDERNRGEQGMSDREVTRRRNLGGNVRSRVSASSLGDHGPQSAIQKFHKGKAKQRREIHKSGRGMRGDTGESGGQSRYQANKDHSDGYPSITKRGDGPY